jgi:hypothetical protein
MQPEPIKPKKKRKREPQLLSLDEISNINFGPTRTSITVSTSNPNGLARQKLGMAH